MANDGSHLSREGLLRSDWLKHLNVNQIGIQAFGAEQG